MRAICTGISGTGRMELLQAVVELARARGVGEVALFDVRETMFDIARDTGEPVEEETILDMFPRALVLLRAAALEKILSHIEAERPAHWILNTHAVFRWKNSLISGFDPHYLSRLDPHLFLTVTSGIKTTLSSLARHPRWEGVTEEDILTWREEEQFFSEEMARIHRKRQVLLPRRTSAESLFRLLFQPDVPCAYLSYPMQHVEAGAERGLAHFKRRLESRMIVFDPADVNDFVVEGADNPPSDGGLQLATLGDAVGVRRDRLHQHIADQIVSRDYKLVTQSDLLVVYYDAPVASPGVISEMKFAQENGKQVYGVWLPRGEPSVFFTRYCSSWFRGEDGLFEHLERTSKQDPGASTRSRAGRRHTRAEREAEQVAQRILRDT